MRALCATAPSTFTQVARNPAHTVEIGGDAVVFAPAYGSPFVRDLAGGRRYGSMADFENFVKLAWSIPWLHHSGGTVCEPVDVPVNKRHLDMVYAHLRYSDKPFMGSVTVPSRAEDSIEMARIAFGAEFVEANCVILGNVNVNSPLVWDGAMTGAIRAYAGANQAPVVVPFILGGAMGPVTLAGDIAQAHAETLVGVALGQLTRPGSPVVYGNFLSSMALRSGRADVRHARAGDRVARRRPARPPGRAAAALLGLVHHVEGARRAGDAGVGGLDAGGDPVRRQLHPPLGGLARGRAGRWGTRSSSSTPTTAAPCTATCRASTCPTRSSRSTASARSAPGKHFFGAQHTLRHYETAFWDSWTADNSSFEQWRDAGERRVEERAADKVAELLAAYEPPPIDDAVDEALREFVARRKAEMPDAWA